MIIPDYNMLENNYNTLKSTLEKENKDREKRANKLIDNLYKRYNGLIDKLFIRCLCMIYLNKDKTIYNSIGIAKIIKALDKEYKRIIFEKGTCKLINKRKGDI